MYKNYHLFNLVEHGVSIKNVETLVNAFKDSHFDPEKSTFILNDSEVSSKINELYNVIDKKKISSYVLILTGLSSLIVEKIAKIEPDLELLYDNLIEFSEQINLQERTIKIIDEFCRQIFNRKRRIESYRIKKLIIDILSDTSVPLTGTDIWGKMQNAEELVSYDTVFQIIYELHNQGSIQFSPTGYKLKLPTLDNLLSRLPQYESDLISLRMQGYTLQVLADKYQLSRQRVLQKINSIIARLPLVQYEDRYADIFQQYNMPLKDAVVIFASDRTFSERLYQYVQLKYVSQNQGDKVIEYLRDFDVIDSDFAKKILLERGKILLDSELIDNTFIELFKFFSVKENIVRVDSDTFVLFNKFLKEENIFIEFDPLESKEVTFRKLENSGSFIRSKDVVINIDLLKFEHEVLEVFEDFLSTVSCLVSTELLIKDKKEILSKYNINDKHELHAILKFLYATKYPDIRFSRTPHIEQINYDKATFIDSLVEMAQPIELNAFYEIVNELTGIETKTFASYASRFLPTYTHNGIVETVEYDLSDEEKGHLRGILKAPLCSVSIFEKMVKIYREDKANIYSRNSVLEQMDYKRIGNIILKNYYTSVESAMNEWLNELPKVMDSKEILNYIEENHLKYRMRNLFNNLIMVYIDKESILNTRKVLNIDELVNFRNMLIEMIPKKEIFTTYYLLKTSPFKDFIDSMPSFKSLGVEFLTNVLKSHSDIYSNNGDTNILRKGISVKKDDLVGFLIGEKNIVSAFDLRDILLIRYGIDNIDINQSYIRNLGYFYSNETDKIYLNKDLYIEKVSDYLND